jgi:hypothetical protein
MIICFVDGVADFLRSAFASTNPTINSDWLGAASKQNRIDVRQEAEFRADNHGRRVPAVAGRQIGEAFDAGAPFALIPTFQKAALLLSVVGIAEQPSGRVASFIKLFDCHL